MSFSFQISSWQLKHFVNHYRQSQNSVSTIQREQKSAKMKAIKHMKCSHQQNNICFHVFFCSSSPLPAMKTKGKNTSFGAI